MRGPLVRQAFQLYATGRYTIDSLARELTKRGLRNRDGRTLNQNNISRILNNSFYTGVIRIASSQDTFMGRHAPLIPMALFKQVQARLSGHVRGRKWIHDFTLRGMFRCSLCGRFLIGERQKGHVYYRCHTSKCPTRPSERKRLSPNSWGLASDCKRGVSSRAAHPTGLRVARRFR